MDRVHTTIWDETGGTGVFASDYERDAADIDGLLGGGAHLVGHSYGGVGAMLAAARSPGAVRSLNRDRRAHRRPAAARRRGRALPPRGTP